jgi:hypothetical protein
MSTAAKNTLLKVTAEQVEVPAGMETVRFENDGSLKIRLHDEAKTILERKQKAMREFFYSKPDIHDVANCLILLSSQISDDDLADALERRRRKPKKRNLEDSQPEPVS